MNDPGANLPQSYLNDNICMHHTMHLKTRPFDHQVIFRQNGETRQT